MFHKSLPLKYSCRLNGFTIIELLVAVSITGILLFLINKIYNDAVGVARRGVQTADVIASHRGVADQIARDFKNQVPPGNAAYPGRGFMAILHKQINDVRMPDPSGGSGFLLEDLCADQMMFVRYASDLAITDGVTKVGDELLESAGPGNSSTFTPGSSIRADYARVFYGHLDYTNEDGTRPTQTLVDATNGNSSGLMNNGWNWMLGRQALLLVGPQMISNSTGNWVSSGGGPYWTTPFYNSTDGGISTGLPTADERMFMGYGDWTRYGLHSDQVWDQGGTNEVSRAQSNIVNNVIIGLSSSDTPANFPLVTAQTHSGTADSYRSRVYDMTFGQVRLKANPVPAKTLQSWQVGQMHPIAMMNVSDIIIEFAADTRDDSGIVYTGSDSPDGRPDVDSDGNIIWYGLNNPPTWVASDFPDESGSGGVAFPDPNDPNNSNPTPAITPNADAAYVWRHDYRYNWPYLIRFRYRVHDTRGDLTSTAWDSAAREDQPVSGKWFEVIVKVERGDVP